jgi:hypothetical protein
VVLGVLADLSCGMTLASPTQCACANCPRRIGPQP